MRALPGALLVGLALLGRPALALTEPEREALHKTAKAHAVHKLEFWRARFHGKALDEKVYGAPPEVLDYIGMQNRLDGFAAVPGRAEVSAGFRADLKTALAELPETVKSKVDPKLIGVFLGKNLGSTAFTDFAWDAAGKTAAGYVVLDAAALEKRANEWMTWKERSPFLPDGATSLEAQIEDASHDDRKNAIQYILLHELGHVLAYKTRIHPLWTTPAKDVRNPQDFLFSRLTWTIQDGRYHAIVEDALPRPGPLPYYIGGAGAPSAALMPRFYAWLGKTDFATLYASTNPFDDFAEAFANYVHVVLMRKPFRIVVKNGKTATVYGSCWEQARCREKRKLLEALVGSAAD